MWIDTHCHLQDLENVDAVVARAHEVSVEHFICVGTDLQTSQQAIQLSKKFPDVSATVGLHPHDSSRWVEESQSFLELIMANQIVAIGETGLDYHYMHSPKEIQQEVFRAHVELANEHNLALIIHCRDAWDDVFRILQETGCPARTILHCFTGGPPEAERALELGAYLSFSGIVTFPNAQRVRDAMPVTPLDRMLIETDSPFLTPVPHRGTPNEPAFVALVGTKIAQILDRPTPEIAQATSTSARTVFSL